MRNVTFSITSGDGNATLSAASDTTDSDGQAETGVILGDDATGAYSITAMSQGQSVSGTATVTGTDFTLYSIHIVSGPGSGAAGDTLPFVVEVRADEVASPDEDVTFSITSGDGNATLSTASDTTDTDGQAQTTVILGTAATGAYSITATSQGQSVTGTATVTTEPPEPPGLQPPLIVSFFSSENETVTNGEIDVTAIAVDPDGDNSLLTFDFSAEAGTFSDQTPDINDPGQAVSVVTWTAPATIPEDPIKYLIDVVVTDEDELTAHTGDDPDAQRPSLSVIVRLHCQRPDRPDAPTVTALSSTSLNVKWIAPNNNGCDIEDYDLRYRVRADPDETQNEWTEHNADNDEWLPATELSDVYEETFTGLTDLSTEYQVRATNLAGTSDWSPSGYLEHTPPTVTIVADPDVIASSESAIIPNQSTITVTATDTIDDVSDLTYVFNVFRVNDDNTESDLSTVDLSGTGNVMTFTHPGTNADYQIQVIVTNLGNIPTTERVLVRAIDIPDQPEIPSVTLIDSSSVEVRWIEPENNRSEISDYDLRYKLVTEVSENYLEWLSEQAFLDLCRNYHRSWYRRS